MSGQNQVNGKHVMISYHWDDQPFILTVYEYLTSKNIPVWMDIKGGMKTNLYDSMSLAIQESAVILCFMTPKYQDYPFCRKELQYAADLRKPVIPCLLTPSWQHTDWLAFVTAGSIYLDFRDVSDENIEKKLQRLVDFIHILSNDIFKNNRPESTGTMMLMTQQQKTIHMILIGRAGSGKSSLGNTILGEKQFDLYVSSHSGITDKCKVGFRYFHEQQANLIVIDTPGFFNNEKDIERSLQVAIGSGTYAILLALSLELGLTNQEEKMINTLVNMYGNNIFQYIIVVFTGLDRIEGDIQIFIIEQCSSSLKNFLEKCGNRYIAINNNTNINDKNQFVSNLIELIMNMSSSTE